MNPWIDVGLVVCCVAALVAAWPYMKNLALLLEQMETDVSDGKPRGYITDEQRKLDIECFGRALDEGEAKAMDELAWLVNREVDDDDLSEAEKQRYVELYEFLREERELPIPFGVEI